MGPGAHVDFFRRELTAKVGPEAHVDIFVQLRWQYQCDAERTVVPGISDMKEAGIAVQVQEGDAPCAGEDARPNLEEAVADELGGLPQVSGNDQDHDKYLPFPSLEVGGIQVADLQQGEELLARRAVVAVRAGDHDRDLECSEGLARLIAAMVAAAVEQKDRVVAPVGVLGVEAADQPVQKGAEQPRLVALLADGEVCPPVRVDASCEGQPVAERLGHVPHGLGGDAPAIPDEGPLVQVGLVDVQDPLAAHHELDQHERELLALVEAADAVGPRRQRLHPLELQPEVGAHDLPDLLRRELIRACDLHGLQDLLDARDAPVLLDHPDRRSLDGRNLLLALLLLLCAVLIDLDAVLVLAGDAADEPRRYTVLHGDVPPSLLLDQERVGDVDDVGGRQVAEPALAVVDAEVSVVLGDAIFFLGQHLPALTLLVILEEAFAVLRRSLRHVDGMAVILDHGGALGGMQPQSRHLHSEGVELVGGEPELLKILDVVRQLVILGVEDELPGLLAVGLDAVDLLPGLLDVVLDVQLQAAGVLEVVGADDAGPEEVRALGLAGIVHDVRQGRVAADQPPVLLAQVFEVPAVVRVRVAG